MSGLFRAERQPDVAPPQPTDLAAQPPSAPVHPVHPVATWRLHGALFFGAAAKIDPIIQAVETGPPGMDVELDACELVALDTTGLDALEQILKAVAARGGRLSVVHLHEQPRSLIERSGFADRLAAQGGSGVDV
jgi:sulfate permease, SulP family